MRAAIEEFHRGTRIASHTIMIDRPCTIGRSRSCTVQIGGGFDEPIARGISRVQASILIEGEAVVLIDGTVDEPSSNGIHQGNRQIDRLTLVPGIQATLYRAGDSMVQLRVIDDTVADADHSKDTFTGADLLETFQERADKLEEKVEGLQGTIAKLEGNQETMKGQISQLLTESSDRKATDEKQSAELAKLNRDLRRVVSGGLAAIALVLLVFAFNGNLSQSEKEEWRKTLNTIVQAMVAVGFGVGAVQLQQGKPDK